MASPLKELSYGSIEIYIDETLGIGSYGKVCKAKCGQLPCAAKLLHDTMFQDNDPGINRFLERFQQECQFLSTIKHPNIVQFLRTAINPETRRPILLMELMDESLTRFLERSTCTISYHFQLNICHDVALALSYLHFNSIIHRDLSSNNVLLVGAGSRAKVTDFGMSKLTGINPRMTPLTQCPGTTVYMPPEALTSPPHYSNKLDCFSYGVLTVQIATRKFPNPGDGTTFLQDSRYPTGRVIALIPEIERRKKDIDLIDPYHPLRPVALYCLKDNEKERPSANDLCERLASLKRERRYNHSVEQSRNHTASVQRLELELQQKTEEYQNALDAKIVQYQEAMDAKERYRSELEKFQIKTHSVEQSINQTASVQRLELELQRKTEEYQNALDANQVQYQEAADSKERYKRELEQLQLQYQAVKQQRNMLQHELKEFRVITKRIEQHERTGSLERNEESKSPLKAEAVPHKKSRNVPESQLSSSDHSPGLPGGDLTLLSVMTFLKEGDFPADKAESLGEYIGIKPGRISTLKTKSGGDPDRLLSNVITEWLNNDSEKSCQKLATALKYCEHSLMAKKLAPRKDDGSFSSQLVSNMPLAIPEKLEHSDELLAVKENISKLETTLSELAFCLLRELREKSISVDDIVDYLCVVPLSFNREIYNLIHNKIDEIEDEKNLRRFIILLNTVWNFLDYHLLEYIIIKFGSKSLKESMRQYISEFENFQRNTTLYHFAQCWPGRQKKPPEYVEVTAKLRLDPKTCTLNMLDELRKSIQRKFFPSLSEYINTLLHGKHMLGSFVITWILPPQLADQLIRAANRPENHSFFKENNILSFSVRNRLLYKEKGLPVQAIKMASPLKELSYGSVEIYTDETLGIGSYGKVYKAKCGQLPCAAKLLHDTMFQDNDPGINRFLGRFQQECQFLRTIKHPNIVQFLGNPETGRPVLLMELMDESLTRFLERSTSRIPYHIQLNICHDVALALSYLHSNSIIHRDLSSNNVLLIGAGSRAKVTDFGMSKLTDMNPRMTPLTQCPGTTVYMPPEALTSPPHYSNKLDCFLYGVLIVQIATQKFPNPGDATTFLQDSRFPTGRIIVLIPEINCRKKDIDPIDFDHPLRPVALHCLKDIETKRPSADDLCERLASLKKERRYTHSVEQSRNQTASVQRLELELRQKTEEYPNALDVKEVQYQEAVKQHEVQRNMLQHELKESKTREQQLHKELNDTRGL